MASLDGDGGDAPMCRFCFEPGSTSEADAVDPLVSPCECRGGQKYIHASCLLRWQRVVLISQPTHPSYWRDDDRSNVCSVCKTTFKTAPPSRLTLMSSFTGPEIAACIDEDFLLVSHAAFSARLREKTQEMSAGLRRVCGYEHWIDGTYLITRVSEREGSDDDEGDDGANESGSREHDAGEDLIVAVNLNGRNDIGEVVRGESRLFELVDGAADDGRRVRTRFVLHEDGTIEANEEGDEASEGVREPEEAAMENEEDGSEHDAGDSEEGNEENEEEAGDSDDEEENEGEEEDAPSEDEEEGDAPPGARRRRGSLMSHLRQLLSPFGPIYEVYQRYRRRCIIAEVYEATSHHFEVDIDTVQSAVEVETFTGGPCDVDSVALCIVVGYDNERAYAKYEFDLHAGMREAYKVHSAMKKCELQAGSVVKTIDEGRQRIGVITKFDDETQLWRITTSDGVLSRKISEMEVVQKARTTKLLVFFGDARWSRAQLLGEIARGHWGLAKSDPIDVANPHDSYRRVVDSGSLVFAPLSEMTEEFMRNALGEMNRIRSSGQLERAISPAPAMPNQPRER